MRVNRKIYAQATDLIENSLLFAERFYCKDVGKNTIDMWIFKRKFYDSYKNNITIIN